MLAYPTPTPTLIGAGRFFVPNAPLPFMDGEGLGWGLEIPLERPFQTPPAELPIAARGDDHRRSRGLPSPHAAFFIPS